MGGTVAMDGVLLGRLDLHLRIPVLLLLLRLQDQDDGLLPDMLLLRLHRNVLLR